MCPARRNPPLVVRGLEARLLAVSTRQDSTGLLGSSAIGGLQLTQNARSDSYSMVVSLVTSGSALATARFLCGCLCRQGRAPDVPLAAVCAGCGGS